MTISIPATVLKPIETLYRGHRFRSRLEARWAVFFDALGLRWEYEVEGYELSDGTRYLPDFLVKTPQGADLWIEIKPSSTDGDDKFSKFEDALSETEGWGRDGLYPRAALVSGTPLQWLENDRFFCPRCGQPAHLSWQRTDSSYCQECDFETPGGGDNDSESNGVMGITWTPCKGSVRVEWPELNRFHQIVTAAATKAQRARFEFGEEG